MSEKFNAMVSRDLANSRMKDFYDLILMFRSFHPEAAIPARAIERTFAKNGTPLPRSLPLALTSVFGEDEGKRIQWNAFKKKNRLTEPMGDLLEVVREILPHLINPHPSPDPPDAVAAPAPTSGSPRTKSPGTPACTGCWPRRPLPPDSEGRKVTAFIQRLGTWSGTSQIDLTVYVQHNTTYVQRQALTSVRTGNAELLALAMEKR